MHVSCISAVEPPPVSRIVQLPRRATARESMAQRLPEVHRHLSGSGVGFVELKYDGRGGMGRFTSVTFHGANAEPVGIDLPSALRARLMVFFSELLELRYADWKSGEGACEFLLWDLTCDGFERQHNYRFIAYEASFHPGL